MFLTKLPKESPAGTHRKLPSPYLLLYLGAALPTLSEVRALIRVTQALSCLALPVPACSTFLYY